MNHWLVKEEPEKYPFDEFKKDKKTTWSKVKNYQARNNMREMKKGDLVLYYHSGKERQIVGIAKVAKGGYSSPEDDTWTWVDLTAGKKLKNPVSLAEIKSRKFFSDFQLVTHSRLSVVPVKKAHFDKILELSEK
ncbi:MAG: EVE domain-containing protein [Acidobacteriota bacterium]|nr:MAG: EVE domain-containing protein [Acidobacteriota bacterium]